MPGVCMIRFGPPCTNASGMVWANNTRRSGNAMRIHALFVEVLCPGLEGELGTLGHVVQYALRRILAARGRIFAPHVVPKAGKIRPTIGCFRSRRCQVGLAVSGCGESPGLGTSTTGRGLQPGLPTGAESGFRSSVSNGARCVCYPQGSPSIRLRHFLLSPEWRGARSRMKRSVSQAGHGHAEGLSPLVPWFGWLLRHEDGQSCGGRTCGGTIEKPVLQHRPPSWRANSCAELGLTARKYHPPRRRASCWLNLKSRKFVSRQHHRPSESGPDFRKRPTLRSVISILGRTWLGITQDGMA